MKSALYIIFCVFTLGGCIGSMDQPKPAEKWTGKPSIATSLPTTSTMLVKDICSDPGFEIGITRVPPTRIIESARLLLEPIYGPMNYERKPIANGNMLFYLLTPRYDISMLGLQYRWIEVRICFDPSNGRSIVETTQMYRYWNLMSFSKHGGLIPFPISGVAEMKTKTEHKSLRALMRSLNDPDCLISDWGKVDD